MSAIELGKAMSSRARLEILDLLSRKRMSIKELSREVSLKEITVRHHVNVLKRIGLIGEYGEERRKIGRPVVRYQASEKPMSIEHRKRQYELLSSTLMQALLETLGRDKAKDALRKIGRGLGENLAREITEKKNVAQWNMEAVKKHVIQERLSEVGAIPEIIDYDSKTIRFRMYNCVFHELAKKYPDLICESLDETFMDTLLKRTVGKARADRITCIAHDDKFCECVIRLGK